MQSQATYPNIEKLDAMLRVIPGNPNVSFQTRSIGSGFFTVTYWPAGDQTRCAIGQGDTLAEALRAARQDAAALLSKVSIADLEKAAA